MHPSSSYSQAGPLGCWCCEQVPGELVTQESGIEESAIKLFIDGSDS